ncbi:MAG: helix-turn-helix transcriptional regulator [Clostridia bacterium]|nr:helix-turn-helix transcriptional regulator [Clostridia bacterium]
MFTEEKFAKKLKELRCSRGLSSRELGRILGRSSSYVSMIERNNALPTLPVFFKICEYFNVSPLFFYWDDVMISETPKNLLLKIQSLSKNDRLLLHTLINRLM